MSLYELCKSGDSKAVHQAIHNGASDWNWGLRGACRGGHKDLVLLMVQYGAKDWMLDYMLLVRAVTKIWLY